MRQVRAVPCGGRFHIQGRPQALPAACRQARSMRSPAHTRISVGGRAHAKSGVDHRIVVYCSQRDLVRLLQLRACAASAEPRHGAGRRRRAGASQRPTAGLRQRLQRDTTVRAPSIDGSLLGEARAHVHGHHSRIQSCRNERHSTMCTDSPRRGLACADAVALSCHSRWLGSARLGLA